MSYRSFAARYVHAGRQTIRYTVTFADNSIANIYAADDVDAQRVSLQVAKARKITVARVTRDT
jgi:hypothetical protein